jgi:hypothetical protein
MLAATRPSKQVRGDLRTGPAGQEAVHRGLMPPDDLDERVGTTAAGTLDQRAVGFRLDRDHLMTSPSRRVLPTVLLPQGAGAFGLEPGLAASALWEDERQTADDAAARPPATVPAARPSAGGASNAINVTARRRTAATPVNPCLGFTRAPSGTSWGRRWRRSALGPPRRAAQAGIANEIKQMELID